MKKTIRVRLSALLLCAGLLLNLCACGETQRGEPSARTTPVETRYAIPEPKTAQFHPDLAETDGAVRADFSALAEGYVAVSVVSQSALKFQVTCGDTTYNYNLQGDGTPAVFPLNLGSGSYQFRVMENIAEDKYAPLWTQSRQVTLADEFQPYLRPSQMVNYSADSQCAALAAELAGSCEDDLAVASAVYDYLVEHIRYDQEKAAAVTSGYLPDPDETLASEKGICFDYAALAAAMLRSVGIPCKLITGYVEPDEVYHAWNEIYLESQGWITVEIRAGAESWKRVDITFAASGAAPEETDDDSRYTTRYTY